MKREPVKVSSNLDSQHRGFTLIELLVVVAIIGILAAIVLNQFNEYKQNAFNGTAKSDLRNAITAEEAVYAESQAYIDCADPDTCDTVLPGFRATRDDNGTSPMTTFQMTPAADGESFVGEATHSRGSAGYTYNSAAGIIQEN